MPTECERGVTSPVPVTEIKENSNCKNFNEDLATHSMMENGGMSSSQTSTTSNSSSSCNGGRKTSITSPDPTAYVAKARVTRPTPPPPPYNPMQFVQIKPCNLYQTAQEQLKKAEEVKKIKEIRKEEPEDWQNNLDNWKSSRRKRVEHIIDRVVEVKKLELEEHDRTRRKSKTFSEMIEERGERSGGRGLNKLVSLAVYAEDEANDLSDLGIGTSSASGKSSLSEDYDNNSVMSDNAAELDKTINNSTNHKPATIESTTREYISSPGYETSSSTAPASSPDPCEYTYEGAIQDYKQRVSRAASGLTAVALNKLTSQQQHQQLNSKESTPERPLNKETAYPPRRGSKIEDRLMGFEVKSPSEECVEKNKVNVPKIDISKRKVIFESQEIQNTEPKFPLASNSAGVPRVTLRDRFQIKDINSEPLTEQPKKEFKRLSGDITSIKERLQSLEQHHNIVNGANGSTKATANKLVDIPVPPLKERLSSLQNAVSKEEVRKPPVVLIDARQLEIMKSEEEKAQLTLKESTKDVKITKTTKTEVGNIIENSPNESLTHNEEDIDKDDSGIHTADDVELDERLQVDIIKKEQELKLNAAIEALAKEEKQLSEAANAVNQIEAEFEELSLGPVSLPPLASNSNASATPITNDHMEYSVSSTNPQLNSNICSSHKLSSSHNNTSSYSSCSSSDSSGKESNSNVTDLNVVKGLDFKTASNLRRKPTNEMVHAKNLLRIFKETFQNDIELDVKDVSEEQETQNIKDDLALHNQTDLSLNTEKLIFQKSANCSAEAKKESKIIDSSIESANSLATSSSSYPMTVSSIPRSMNPLGKPPMSPQSTRSTTKLSDATPPSSPSLARKNNSQFSINGRVEIFNSKTMTSSPKAANLAKQTTPTMTANKTQMPHINAPKNTLANNIVLPIQRSQQQLPQEATIKEQQKKQHTTTVAEPLSTLSTATATTTKQGRKIEQLKSIPAHQTVNEPQTFKLDDGETKHHHQQRPINPNNELVKQQHSEIVVCAPPITIVNPDELPKPNTVKNLSTCFQQQAVVAKTTPRSRIPQATPPPSPVLPKRHICNKAENIQAENIKLSLSPTEDKKKWSTVSSSSTSSTSTNSTVIENNKKMSIISSSSTNTEDMTPTIVHTKAQIHREPETEGHISDAEISEDIKLEKKKKTNIFPNMQVFTKNNKKQTDEVQNPHNYKDECRNSAKVLDKQATQELVEQMIKTDKENRILRLNSNDIKNNRNKIKPLAPLEINMATEGDETDSHINSRAGSLQSPTRKSTVSCAANIPYSSPLAPLDSCQAEVLISNTPSVLPTLHDKNQSNYLTPRNQKPSLDPLNCSNFETTSAIRVKAELPLLPECGPNDSTLYKLASSAPHSPTSPSTNSERYLAMESALCNSFLNRVLQRQHTVEEESCQKVEKNSLPFNQGSTGYKDVSKMDIKQCDGIAATAASKLQNTTQQRQKTVDEELCHKLDIHLLPDDKKHPVTGYKSLSPTEIHKCDNFFATGSGKPSAKLNSKPNSPIIQARAAHSKALIDTCEKIIAEERLASTQLKSSLPSGPVGTPLIQKKSKIPKPIPSCCMATESLNETDLKATNSKDNNNAAVARMHVVETQIKVTTTTPPNSPIETTKQFLISPQPAKKTKNIFDFLKKNFGVGGHTHKDANQNQQQLPAPSTANKAVVLSEQDLKELEKIKYDEIQTCDNAKFYIPSKAFGENEVTSAPPLPKTPAPVNIEITRKVITDEILQDDKTKEDLTKEIDDLLDDELNKLNTEIEKLEQASKKQ